MTPDRRRALLSDQTSRRNKMSLLAQYRLEGYDIKHRWKGEPYNSRLEVKIPGTVLGWIACRSFDEDILPTFKYGKES